MIDELTTMPGNKCILQLCGLHPFLSPKYDLKQHPNYRYTAEADKRNTIDASKLVNHRMKKLNPNKQYTVYEVSADEETAAIDENEDILIYDDVDDPNAFA
jgi:type IV secretion system protein VirD4